MLFACAKLPHCNQPGTSSAFFRFVPECVLHAGHFQQVHEKSREQYTKPEVVVRVLWIVPVAIRTAHVPVVVCIRPAADHAGSIEPAP